MATRPHASWQRCRTHLAANLLAATPKSPWSRVEALHSVYDQPDVEAVNGRYDGVLEGLYEAPSRDEVSRSFGLLGDFSRGSGRVSFQVPSTQFWTHATCARGGSETVLARAGGLPTGSTQSRRRSVHVGTWN